MLKRTARGKTEAKKLTVPAIGMLAAAFALAAEAGGPIGLGAHGGAGAQIGVGAGMGPMGVGAGIGGAAAISGGANARANTPAVGAPAPNARALENANGGFIEDRKFGLDRARERMSEQGAAHASSAAEAQSAVNAKR